MLVTAPFRSIRNPAFPLFPTICPALLMACGVPGNVTKELKFGCASNAICKTNPVVIRGPVKRNISVKSNTLVRISSLGTRPKYKLALERFPEIEHRTRDRRSDHLNPLQVPRAYSMHFGQAERAVRSLKRS